MGEDDEEFEVVEMCDLQNPEHLKKIEAGVDLAKVENQFQWLVKKVKTQRVRKWAIDQGYFVAKRDGSWLQSSSSGDEEESGSDADDESSSSEFDAEEE